MTDTPDSDRPVVLFSSDPDPMAELAKLRTWKQTYETGTFGFVLNAADQINEQNLRLKDTLTHIALEQGVDVDTLRAWALGVLKEVFPEDFDPNYKGPSDGS